MRKFCKIDLLHIGYHRYNHMLGTFLYKNLIFTCFNHNVLKSFLKNVNRVEAQLNKKVIQNEIQFFFKTEIVNNPSLIYNGYLLPICQKISRLIFGNINHIDTWTDIFLYTKLLKEDFENGHYLNKHGKKIEFHDKHNANNFHVKKFNCYNGSLEKWFHNETIFKYYSKHRYECIAILLKNISHGAYAYKQGKFHNIISNMFRKKHMCNTTKVVMLSEDAFFYKKIFKQHKKTHLFCNNILENILKIIYQFYLFQSTCFWFKKGKERKKLDFLKLTLNNRNIHCHYIYNQAFIHILIVSKKLLKVT